jgi:hypothetical protein
MTPPPDWSALSARDKQGNVIVSPCLALNIYLDETDPAQVQDFFQRALDAVGPQLTHYLAERMQRPAKLTPRALGMLGTWLRKPKEAHEYVIKLWGGGPRDVSPWNITVSLQYIAADPARRARYPKFLQTQEQRVAGGQPEIPCTVLRVTVPVDAELARPEAWVPWTRGFRLLKEGVFLLGESGYSLNIWDDIEPLGIQYSLCARHPGLDWFSIAHGRYLRRYEPSLDAVLPQVKRAAWLTFLAEVPVKVLGGVDRIGAALADQAHILLHPFAHGLGIQAGPRPELGDLARHELLPLQQRVARLVSPVRLRGIPLAYKEDFVEHWFNMFDKDHP